MNYIIPLITLFALLILGLSFVRYKLAIVLYLSYMILVPYFFIDLPVWSFSNSSVVAVLLGVLIFDFRLKKNISPDFTAVMPFFFLLASLLLITLFTDMSSPKFQLYNWGVDFMNVCVFPFIIWNVSINDDKFVINAKNSLMISILIAGMYAILTMKLGGENPYAAFLSSHLNLEIDYIGSYIEGSRIRNQGTMLHPFNWVYYLCLLCCYFSILLLKERKRIYLLLFCFIAFNIIIADVRTGLASMIIALTYIYVRYNNIRKTIFYGTAIVVIAALIIAANEELSQRFLSLIDISGTRTELEGSSFQMRIEQFYGCLDEISHSPLFGNGYGWTQYYLSIFLEHPVIFGFESLIFTVLCNHGMAGVIIWLIFGSMLFRVPRKILGIKKNVYCVDGLVVFFFTYTVATGLFEWLAPFALFYSLLLGYLYQEEKKKLIQSSFYEYSEN